MNSSEFADLVPWLVTEKIEEAGPAVPLLDGEVHEQQPNWSFRTGSALTLASIFPKANELRITSGLAINIPYSADLKDFVNYMNVKQLVFGRAYHVEHNDPRVAAVLMQEIVFGESLSWDFPPSIQNLLRIIVTLSGQADRLSKEITARFEARSFSDAEVVHLLAYG